MSVSQYDFRKSPAVTALGGSIPVELEHERTLTKQVPFFVYVHDTAKKCFIYGGFTGVGVMTGFVCFLISINAVEYDRIGWALFSGILGGLGCAGAWASIVLHSLRKDHDRLYAVMTTEKDRVINEPKDNSSVVRSFIPRGKKHKSVALFTVKEMNHLRQICQVNNKLLRDHLKGGFVNYTSRWEQVKEKLHKCGVIDDDNFWTEEGVDWLFAE